MMMMTITITIIINTYMLLVGTPTVLILYLIVSSFTDK